MDYKHSSHSTFNLKYHLVFCTKYRYRILTGQTTVRSREIIRKVCTANYVDIVRGNITPEHILTSMSPSIVLSKLVQYINGMILCCYSWQSEFYRCTEVHRRTRRSS
ncbi:MAG: IS200/IS605 family transposase [Wolbachia sp.]|nr:IS200/IS605 family transposase [Wolbachia sp.]MDD9336742.1 IS200/IS605 family transposase [Wolbachia sp.]